MTSPIDRFATGFERLPAKQDAEVAHPSRHRLLVLACSSRKRPANSYVRARDLYDGPLWQTLRHADPDQSRCKLAFLSARYGFRDADTPIEPYDLRLTRQLADAMIAGGMTTRWPRPPSPRHPDNFGSDPGFEIASLSNYGEAPFTEVALVGGALYLEVMGAFLESFQRQGAVDEKATIHVINGPIGKMRRDLRGWVEGG